MGGDSDWPKIKASAQDWLASLVLDEAPKMDIMMGEEK
jgi:hypothetical protein